MSFNLSLTLLVSSCILLVIASPICREVSNSPPCSYDDGINGLSLGIDPSGVPAHLEPNSFNHGSEPLGGVHLPQAGRPSGTFRVAGHREPNYVDHNSKPSADQQAELIYSYGTVNGKDIILGIGRPERSENLPPFPRALLEEQDIEVLEHIATRIRQRSQSVIKKLKDDTADIHRATRFVSGQPVRNQKQDVTPPAVPQLPEPGSEGYREELLEMIKDSDKKLRRAVYNRNSWLINLARVPHSGNIPNPDRPNIYVTYWEKNQFKFSPARSAKKRLPELHHGTFAFWETYYGTSVTLGIGLPTKMPNVANLPSDLAEFSTEDLTHIALDIFAPDQSGESQYSVIMGRVLHDTNRIFQAITFLTPGRPITAPSQKFEVPELPVLGTSIDDYRAALVLLIFQCHRRLHKAVSDRNTQLDWLNGLQLPPDRVQVHNVDLKDVYVAHWMQSHRHHLASPLSGTGTKPTQLSTNKRPLDPAVHQTTSVSKRRMEGSRQAVEPADGHTHKINVDIDPNLADMLQEIEDTLRPQGPTHSSGSLDRFTSGHTSDHHSTGFQTVHQDPMHNPGLPVMERTASSIPVGQSNTNPPVPEATSSFHDIHASSTDQDEHDKGTYFDFEAW